MSPPRRVYDCTTSTMRSRCRARLRKALAESAAPYTTPIEIVDALFEGLLDGRRGHPVTGGEPQPPDRPTGAAERSLFEAHKEMVAHTPVRKKRLMRSVTMRL